MDVTEVEKKFQAATDTEPPPLTSGVYGARTDMDMRAVYYDTPDLTLLRSRVATLRRREGGEDEGWHVKLSVSAEERLEIHAPLGSLVVPDELRQRLASTVGAAPLVPVATVSTHRKQTEILGAGGVLLGVVCHDDVSAEAAGSTQQWSEMEVESVSGDAEWLAGVAQDFAAAGIVPSTHKSKYAMAVAPVLQAAKPADTAGSVVLDYLGTQIGVTEAHAAGVRLHDPEAVHKSRVATRKIRGTLRTFAVLFEPVPGLSRDLRWHAEELGAARDAAVLEQTLVTVLDTFPADTVDQPARERIRSSLAVTREEAHADLVHSMAKTRYENLRLGLVSLLMNPPFTAQAGGSPDQLAVLVERATQRTVRAVRAAEAQAEDLAAWHRVRKLAKATRYAHEALARHGNDAAGVATARWEAVTDALGRVQDTQVARERLRELSHDARRAGESIDAYQALAEWEVAAGAKALLEAQSALAVAID